MVQEAEGTDLREAVEVGQEARRPTEAVVGLEARAPNGMGRTALEEEGEEERVEQARGREGRAVCMGVEEVGLATTTLAMELRAAKASSC